MASIRVNYFADNGAVCNYERKIIIPDISNISDVKFALQREGQRALDALVHFVMDEGVYSE